MTRLVLLRLVPVLLSCAFLGNSMPPLQNAGAAPNISSLSDADLKSAMIQLTRTQCMGTCPAYTVTIHGAGRVDYDGKGQVKTTGKRQGQISSDSVKTLLASFESDKFWEIEPIYSQSDCKGTYCFDLPSAAVELTVAGKTHRIDHYYGCRAAPKILFELEAGIDKAANVEQWTGDVSKAGPFGTACMNRP